MWGATRYRRCFQPNADARQLTLLYMQAIDRFLFAATSPLSAARET